MIETSEPSQWLLLLVGSLIGLISALIATAWANRSNWALARATGAFARPDIRIMLFGQELLASSSPRHRELWCFLHPGDSSLPAIYPLQFQIANAGDKGTSELVVTLSSQKAFLASEEMRVTASIEPGVLKSGIRRAVSTTGELRQISYALPALGPRTATQVKEPLALTASYRHPIAGEMRTKDEVRVKWAAEISYVAVVALVVFSTDAAAVTRTVRIACLPAADSADALSTLRADRAAALQKYLADLSPWGRAQASFARRGTITYRILSFEPFRKGGTKSSAGFMAAESEDAKVRLTTARVRGLAADWP
jgi:hypothetical protein